MPIEVYEEYIDYEVIEKRTDEIDESDESSYEYEYVDERTL